MQPVLIFNVSFLAKKELEVLNYLIPHLKKLGYETYYDEITAGESLEEAIQINKDFLSVKEEINAYFETLTKESPDVFSFDIDNLIGIKRFIPRDERLKIWQLFAEAFINRDFIEIRKTLLKTFSLLQEQSIKFLGVDGEGLNITASRPNWDDEAEIFDAYQSRLNTMYSSISTSTFGMIDVNRALPIHNALIEKGVPLNNYIFIYIHSKESLLIKFKEKIMTLESAADENAIFEPEIKCYLEPKKPIFLHSFDADLLSPSDIYRKIERLINVVKKQNPPQCFQAAKHTTYFKRQEYYGFQNPINPNKLVLQHTNDSPS